MPNLPSTSLVTSAPAVPATISSGGILFDPARFEHAQRVANMFASSQLVPQHLRGKLADCAIALHMAERLGEDPLVVMQNINIINGRAGWSAQYMIGRANRSGALRGRIAWRTSGTGDSLSVTAFATLAEGGDIDATASMAMAKAEGWTKNSKYQTMPEHMLRWRSATMLIRLYLPEIMLGIPSADEIEDVQYASFEPAPPKPSRPDFLPPAGGPVVASITDSVIASARVVEHVPPPPPEPEVIDAIAAEVVDDGPADTDPYELVTADGQVLSWPAGQEQHYVTSFVTELRNAAKRGRDALTGLWESNLAALNEAPEGVVKEVHAEHKRLQQVLDREEAKAAKAQPATPAASAKATPAAQPTPQPKPAEAPPAAAPVAQAAPATPPAGGDDDLF